MKLPEDAKARPFLDGLNALGTPSATGVNPDRFLEWAVKGRTYELPEVKSNLYKAIGRDPRFSLCEHEQVANAVGQLFSQGQATGKIEDVLDTLSKQIGSDVHPACNSKVHSPILDGVVSKPTTIEKPAGMQKAYERWMALPAEHQVNVGLFGVGALLGAFGCIRNARHSVCTDLDGKKHFEWSNAAVAILQGALAVGCACLAVQAFRGGHAH